MPYNNKAKKKPPVFKTCASCPTPAKCKKAGKCMKKSKK